MNDADNARVQKVQLTRDRSNLNRQRRVSA